MRGVDLFPSVSAMADDHHWLTDELAGVPDRVARGSVVPTFDRDRFGQELADFDFDTIRPVRDVVTWLREQLEHGLVQITHPRYFGLFNPAPSHAAQLADRIAGCFNPQLASASTSPAAVAIERHVIGAVARRVGLPPDASGHFTGGGSEANGTALLCALVAADPAFAARGSRCFAGPPVVYISREAHRAWVKLAVQAGIGRDAVRTVATDGEGRMSAAALEAALASDRSQGVRPVLVVATAGTTGAGMIDPLRACGEVAGRFGAWYHVDAAWAGAAIASERLRPVLDGIEAADSITIDAHKWFATTMGCGMFLTRSPALLCETFAVAAAFMPSHDAVDPYVSSVQWSRRFAGSRLFLSLASSGWAGHAAHVERAVDLAEQLRDILAGRGWRTINRSPVAVLCIAPPPGGVDVPTIVRRVVGSGQAYVTAAEFEGRPVIRACITHGRTAPPDLERLADALEAAAREGDGHRSGRLPFMQAALSIDLKGAEERVNRLVRGILNERIRCPAFARSDKLAEVGLTSIDMVSLMLAVEREFDVEIPQDHITEETFRSVSNIAALMARLAPSAGAPVS